MAKNTYTLYGTPFSLFTGKVRSYLQKKGIPFKEVLSTASVYKRFIIPRTGVRYVPVLQTPSNKVIQDTTSIIDELEKRFAFRSVYPSSAKQRLVALLLETFADEWLVSPAMHYRWNFPHTNQPFIFREFGKVVSPLLPGPIRGWIGKKLGSRFAGFVPMLGITEHTIPAIEASYEALLTDLDAHFAEHPYMLGARPCIADYGLIGPLYAHLYRDPYPGQYMRENAPHVAQWVERMIDGSTVDGEFLPAGQIPATLLPILRRMASEQIPVLIDTDNKLTAWRAQNPDTDIPRTIGNHEFWVEGVSGNRAVLPYALWMFKRPVDYYSAQSQETQLALDDLLQPLGFGDVLQKGLANRLVRRENRLHFAS